MRSPFRQAFPIVSLQQSFIWLLNRRIFVLISCEAPSGLSRESLLRNSITETLGKLNNLLFAASKTRQHRAKSKIETIVIQLKQKGLGETGRATFDPQE